VTTADSIVGKASVTKDTTTTVNGLPKQTDDEAEKDSIGMKPRLTQQPVATPANPHDGFEPMRSAMAKLLLYCNQNLTQTAAKPAAGLPGDNKT